MDRNDYNIAINKNTLECWGIMLIILFVSYFIEVLRGLRTIQYFIIFFLFLWLPYLYALMYNKKNKGCNLNLKYIFVISYMFIYTFVLLTTKTYVTYVYVIPMVSILIAYCDSRLTSHLFLYVTFLNIICIFLQYTEFINGNGKLIFELKDRITMWEIQLALIILSGLFLSKACSLIKKRDDILDFLTDDICKDALTGIYNKKFIESTIYKIYNTNKFKSLAFIDVDDFKKFNTLYGHNFGDEVLITLCEVISNNLTEYDNTYFIRVGGDEFIIFSLDFNKEEFTNLLNKIVKEVSSTKIPFGKKKVGVKITVGVACTDVDKCSKFMDLYNLADKRNMKAKKNGKNHVENN
ncbi:MAG: GGDEF domain-containing protein [Bacilli bacterium]